MLIGVATILAYIGVLFLIPGAILIAVGLTQRNKPEWRVRVLLRRARGHPQEAEALLGQALGIDNDNPEALAANADWRFDNHQWAAAADLFERYLAHVPDDWLAEGHAANAWLNAGNPDAAIPHFLHVREKPFLTDDSRASVTAGLAMAYLRKGDPKQALELARSAPLQRHNLGEGLQQCLFLRALAAYLAGQHSRAISDLDRLAGINPAFPNLDEVRNEMLTGTFKLESLQGCPAARCARPFRAEPPRRDRVRRNRLTEEVMADNDALSDHQVLEVVASAVAFLGTDASVRAHGRADGQGQGQAPAGGALDRPGGRGRGAHPAAAGRPRRR